jgi:glycosyltransferase involved in cell wall biosynthesis
VLPDLELGGAQEVVVLLSSELAARDIEVLVVALHCRPDPAYVDRLTGVRLKSCDDAGRSSSRAMGRMRRVANLYRNVWSAQPAVLHTHQYLLLLLLPYIVYRTIFRCRRPFVAVHTIHNEAHREFSGGLKWTLRLASIAYRMGVVGVACGERVFETLCEAYPRVRFELISNGVPESTTPKTRYSVCVPLRLLCIGRLVPQKNVGLVIDAIAILQKQGRAVDLTVIGDGPQRPSLIEQADSLGLGDHLELLGSVAGAQDLMRDFDLLCLPSKYEGLPMVLLEAGLVGLPVVAADIPSLRYFAEGIWTFRPDEPESLAKTIVDVIGVPDPARRDRTMVLRGMCASRSSRAMADAYLALFQSHVS